MTALKQSIIFYFSTHISLLSQSYEGVFQVDHPQITKIYNAQQFLFDIDTVLVLNILNPQTGDTPSHPSWWEGTPFPGPGRGYPLPRSGQGAIPFPGPDGGYPHASWWGYPIIGYTPPGPGKGVPSLPGPGKGVPTVQTWKGVPPIQTWEGGTPHQGQVQGRGVTPYRHSMYLLHDGWYASYVHAEGLSCCWYFWGRTIGNKG